jgi:hypothetical protein
VKKKKKKITQNKNIPVRQQDLMRFQKHSTNSHMQTVPHPLLSIQENHLKRKATKSLGNKLMNTNKISKKIKHFFLANKTQLIK